MADNLTSSEEENDNGCELVEVKEELDLSDEKLEIRRATTGPDNPLAEVKIELNDEDQPAENSPSDEAVVSVIEFEIVDEKTELVEIEYPVTQETGPTTTAAVRKERSGCHSAKNSKANGATEDLKKGISVQSLQMCNFAKLSYDQKLEIKRKGRHTPQLNLSQIGKCGKGGKEFRRKFSQESYKKFLWLCGCPLRNSLFCYPCLLFNGDHRWTKVGVCDLSNLSRICEKHEQSLSHKQCSLKLGLLGGTSIQKVTSSENYELIYKHNEEVTKNRHILTRIINNLRLQFCGNMHTKKSVVVKSLLNFASNLDGDLKEHFENSVVFGGDSTNLQTVILNCMLEVCQEEITKEIRIADFLSVIVQDTTNISECEQIAVILRYELNGKVVERFWTLKNLLTLNDDAISRCIQVELLKVIPENPEKLISQSYDGAHSAVNILIKKKYPNAQFVHCYAQKLYEIVQQATKHILQARMFFAELSGIPIFFSKSSKRMDALNEVSRRKGSQIPRWNLQFMTVTSIYKNLSDFRKCFEKLADLKGLTVETCRESVGLSRLLKDLEFIDWLEFFSRLMSSVALLVGKLQLVTTDSAKVSVAVESFQKNVEEIKNGTGGDGPPRKRAKGGKDQRPVEQEICDQVILEISDRFKFTSHFDASQLVCNINFASFHKRFPKIKFEKTVEAYPMLHCKNLRTELEVLYSMEELRQIETTCQLLQVLKESDQPAAMGEVIKLLKIVVTTPMLSTEAGRSVSTLSKVLAFLGDCTPEDRLSSLTMLSCEAGLVTSISNFNHRVIDKFVAINDMVEMDIEMTTNIKTEIPDYDSNSELFHAKENVKIKLEDNLESTVEVKNEEFSDVDMSFDIEPGDDEICDKAQSHHTKFTNNLFIDRVFVKEELNGEVLWSEDKPEGQVSSSICETVFQPKKDLLTHEENKILNCGHCNDSFTDLEELHKHCGAVHSLYICNKCNNRIFNSKRGLSTHFTCAHRNTCTVCLVEFASNIDLFQHWQKLHCTMCKKCFESPEKLTKHASDAHPNFRCSCCGLVSKSDVALKFHKRTEHNICDRCNMEFLDKIQLASHEEKLHEIFTCEVCDARFSSSLYLKQHCFSAHSHYPCAICKRIFKNEHYLAEHIRIAHQNSCNVCFLKFTTENDLLQHCKEKHVCCSECKDWFINLETLAKHVSTLHRVFFCSSCGIIYKSSGALTVHKRKEHNSCNLCDLEFLDRIQLASHEEKMHGSFTCSVCDSRFRHSSHLIEHFSAVHRLYICSVCKREFRSKNILAAHMKIIHRIRISCEICLVEFATKNSLLRHCKRVHTAHPLYICSVCQRKFRSKNRLAAHIRVTHQIQLPCKVCLAKFTSINDLQQHCQNVHVFCKECKNWLRSQESLTEHASKAHPIFPCLYCGLNFKSIGVLKVHKVNSHICERCNLALPGRIQLVSHKEEIHGIYTCTQCDARFNGSSHLNQHRITVHSIYFCTICNQHVFKSEQSLNTHIKTSHWFPCDGCLKVFNNQVELSEHVTGPNRCVAHVCKTHKIGILKKQVMCQCLKRNSSSID